MTVDVSKNSPLATLFHLVGLGLLINAFRLTYHPDYVIVQLFNKMGNRTNFLTMWGLFFATVTFVFNILIALFPKISALRNFSKLSLAIALPLESVITTLYWSIVFYDPSMMIIPGVQVSVPLIMDLSLHLYPTILLWIEHLAFSDRCSSSSNGKIKLTKDIQLSRLELLTMVTVAYVARIELLSKLKSDIPLPYPFLNDVTFPNRLPIYIGSAALCYLFSSMGESLHGFLIKP